MNRVRLKPAVTMLSHSDFRALFWALDILELFKHPVLGSLSHLAVWASPWMELVERMSSMELTIVGVT